MKQFQTESKRLLELMINSIYTRKEVFLRELISNASDALDKLAFKALTDSSVGLDRGDLYVKVEIDKEARILTISDNGIGMTAEELERNLGIIAKSGSLEFKSGLEQDENRDAADIIGQFGVGFYSAFMVAERVEVLSKAFGSETANLWVSSGIDGYDIEPAEKAGHGTTITLCIKPDTDEETYSEYLETYRLRELIKKYSDYIRYPIKMDVTHTNTEGGESREHTETETINSMLPIWRRPKAEVSDEEREQFYRAKFYDTEKPISSLTINAEGLVSFTALLFVPRKAPYNYYTRDFRPGLELYSDGVLIMDRCADLLPECFRFVRGVTDTGDLTLNISRETLQHDRQLRVIARNLEKRVKDELKRLMTEAPEDYAEFWTAFGTQLKYGVISDFGAKKELLSELLMFRSAGLKKLISLREYTDAMADGQKYIYYAFGDETRSNPRTESILDTGYDVICLEEDTDEFVVQTLTTFDGKEFRSVNSDDLELPDSAETKEELEKLSAEYKDLLEFARNTLNGRVAEARISLNLKGAPSYITTRGYVTLELERYFKSLPNGEGNQMKAERVLEINAEHPAFDALKSAYADDKTKAEIIVKLMLYRALLAADVEIESPTEFAELLEHLMVS
ncbi:MAG: molecular chaperone HtpG [Oscillospiraceae bacterium]|jgi:molecular chaperone HtpG|nr:molecular chaperone HtpG [Oscillospiraceae bacterium]